MIASAHNIIYCVQHPILMEPERRVREIVQVHDILDDARRLINPRHRMVGNLNGKVKIAGGRRL